MIFWIENKCDPELHKEFKRCHTEYKWTAENLKIDPDTASSATMNLGKGDWGTIHSATAVVKWLAYQDLDENPHVHQQVFSKTRNSEFIAPDIKLKTLSLNNKVGSCGDYAIETQTAYETGLITAPEYVSSGYKKGTQKPAAYKKEIKGNVEFVFTIMHSLLESSKIITA